jgi:chemotaxis signal transduction protein
MALRFRDFYKPKGKAKPESEKVKTDSSPEKGKETPASEKPIPVSSKKTIETRKGAAGEVPVQNHAAQATVQKAPFLPKKSPVTIRTGRAVGDEQNFAVFLVGGEWFGIDLNSIMEILHDFDIIPVPHLPAAFAGVTNLRGESLPVVNMRKLLSEPEMKAEIVSCLITAVGRAKIGLLVDSDVEIVNAETGRLYPLPGFYTKDEMKFLESIFWFKDKFIGILKPEPTLEVLTEWRMENEEK